MDGEGGIVMVMEGRDREGGERGWGEGEDEFKKGDVLLPPKSGVLPCALPKGEQ